MKEFKNNLKNPVISRILIVALLALGFAVLVLNNLKSESTEISYTDFVSFVDDGKILAVTISDGKKISGMYLSNGGYNSFTTVVPYFDESLMSFLSEHNVKVTGKVSEGGLLSYVIQFLPWVIFFILFISMMRNSNPQNMRGMDFGKSSAKVYTKSDNSIKFDDVAGQKEAKEELAEVVDYLKNPEKYTEMGARVPKGVLLVGNPGTGKTLMARAVAGEADVSFLSISGSDFVEMFVGVGASRVRDLFEQAKRLKPCIIFIDEIDAVGRARGAGLGGGHDEREQTLNQLLVEMDGFESQAEIIVIAATNRPDVLDSALLRPGRFDRQVYVSLPDIKEREEILKLHASKMKFDEKVDLKKVACSTPGMSGADLFNILNEAAIFASRRNLKSIGEKELEDARDKILMGTERESVVMSEKERAMTAYHEAGHALQYFLLEDVPKLHKVTIIPRGRAQGVTLGLPEEDRYSETRENLLSQLVIFYGGYAAEQLVYKTSTTGASNDIQRATELARKMVCEWGMCDDVGPVSYGQEDEPIFMGREIARHKNYSEETAKQIDAAIHKILLDAKNTAFENLKKNSQLLDTLANELLKNETLMLEQILALNGFEKFAPAEENN